MINWEIRNRVKMESHEISVFYANPYKSLLY